MTLPMANGVAVPCGPECRHASALPGGAGGWVWCARRGEPRMTGPRAQDCAYFEGCDELAGFAGLRAVLYSAGSATDRLPHEN